MAQANERDQELIARAFRREEDFLRSLSLDPATFESNPRRFFIAGTFGDDRSIYPHGMHYIKDGHVLGEHYERIYFRPEPTDPSETYHSDYPIMLKEVSRVEMKKVKNGYDPYFVSTKIENDGDTVRIYFLQSGEEALIREVIGTRQAHTVGWVYSPDSLITAFAFGRDGELDYYFHLDSIDPTFIKKYPFGMALSVDLISGHPYSISTTESIDHPLAEITSASILQIANKDYLQFVEDKKVMPEGRHVTRQEALLLPRRQFTLARVPIILPQPDPEFPESMKSRIFTPHFLHNPVGANLREDSRWNTPDLEGLTGVRELFD